MGASGRPRVVVSVTMSVDARVSVGPDRLLLDPQVAALWNRVRPGSADAAAARLAERNQAQAVLEGSGSFVTSDAGPLADLPDEAGIFEDFLPFEVDGRKWFVVVDGRGRVRWSVTSADGSELLVLVAKRTPGRHLAYLRREGIPYLVAGDERVDLRVALGKLRELLGVDTVVSQAGGNLNAALVRAGLVDEIQLLVMPAAIGGSGTPSLFDGVPLGEAPVTLRLVDIEKEADGLILLRYEVPELRTH